MSKRMRLSRGRGGISMGASSGVWRSCRVPALASEHATRGSEVASGGRLGEGAPARRAWAAGRD